jgi:glycosyltransferase involved in cell wall biosynthesis
MTSAAHRPQPPSASPSEASVSHPVVDIIIPTNRTSRFLSETITSVVDQTWPHWQLTLVDDGSPDPSALDALAAKVPGARVLHQPPGGTSVARNRGIRETKGPLLVFLDDDDLWMPDRLERQVEAWLKAPQHVGVFCGGTYIDADGRAFGEPWRAEQTLSRRFLSGEVPMPRIVTLMLRRDVCLAAQGFDETIGTGQDLDFTLRLLQLGEMLAVPRTLVRYRRHDANVSKAGSLAGREAIDRFLLKQIREAEQRHDASAALLLREHLRRTRSAAAVESLDGAVTAFRLRDARKLAAECRWASRRPGASLMAAWAKFGRARRTDA